MLDNTLRERWRYYLKRRLDQKGNERSSLGAAGRRGLPRSLTLITLN